MSTVIKTAFPNCKSVTNPFYFSIAMTAREYAKANLRDLDGVGIKGYSIKTAHEMDKPRTSVILPYKKTTFIDEAIRSKKHVPPSNYDVIPNLRDKNTKSAMPKSFRHTIASDCEKFAKRNPRPD